MPIVTGPSGAIQPVQMPDMVGNYGRLMQLRQMQQEAPLRQQALQQQVQSGQMDMKQKQREMDSQDAIMQAWSGSGGDLSKAYQTAAQSGKALPGDLAKIKQADFQLQTQALQLLKEKGQRAIDESDYMTGASDAVKSAPPEARPQVYQQQLQNLAHQGIDISQMPPQYPGDQGFNVINLGLQSHKAALDKAVKDAQTFKDTAQGNEANVNAQLGPAKLAQTQANEAIQRRQEQQRIGIEGSRLGIEGGRLALERQKASLDQAQSGATGNDFLQTLPAGVQAQVKAMANGDIAIPPAGTRNPQAQQLRTAVMTYDPTYTDARYKGKQNFKSSGDAQNVVQLSTAMEHADRAIANSAKAGYAPALGSKTFESADSAAYMQDAEFLTGEVGKLVKNGVLTMDESNKISSGLTSARQNIRDAALNETMDLLGGKARGVFQKYKTATGQDLPVKDFFDANSQQRLSKYKIIDSSSSGGGDPFAQFGGKAH